MENATFSKWSQLPTKQLQIPLHTLQLILRDLIIPNWLQEQATYTSELRVMILNKSFAQPQTSYNAPINDFLNLQYIEFNNI